jgi:hypothetical protein
MTAAAPCGAAAVSFMAALFLSGGNGIQSAR